LAVFVGEGALLGGEVVADGTAEAFKSKAVECEMEYTLVTGKNVSFKTAEDDYTDRT
jgi:hypothetical protein